MPRDYLNGAVPGSTVERATPDDVETIRGLVVAAYTKYIERIGKPPAPMLADYDQLLATHDIFVLRNETQTVGSIVLHVDKDDRSVQLNNLVVDPTAQGRGYGRVLMNFAERFTKDNNCATLKLFTNIKMVENLTLYAKLGFEETERRVDSGYERVYFEKQLL